jgi:hypothetical protein
MMALTRKRVKDSQPFATVATQLRGNPAAMPCTTVQAEMSPESDDLSLQVS